jgi:hypothetical protein
MEVAIGQFLRANPQIESLGLRDSAKPNYPMLLQTIHMRAIHSATPTIPIRAAQLREVPESLD